MKIKACPFCGSQPVIEPSIKEGFWTVFCNSMECLVGPEADDYESKDLALKAWNTRHNKR